MVARTLSRRAHLRIETTREIKQHALAQVTAEGAGAISLRAIAREMGMTARAIYSYFPTRDDLVTALVADFGTSLADALEAARDAHPPDRPAERLLAWGSALREWAIANPAGFNLIYHDPIPGYTAPPDDPVDEVSRRICGGLTRLVAAFRPSGLPRVRWADFPPHYERKVRDEAPGASPAVAALALRVWGRMHGLLTLEIHGRLGAVARDPGALYRAELRDVARELATA